MDEGSLEPTTRPLGSEVAQRFTFRLRCLSRVRACAIALGVSALAATATIWAQSEEQAVRRDGGRAEAASAAVKEIRSLAEAYARCFVAKDYEGIRRLTRGGEEMDDAQRAALGQYVDKWHQAYQPAGAVHVRTPLVCVSYAVLVPGKGGDGTRVLSSAFFWWPSPAGWRMAEAKWVPFLRADPWMDENPHLFFKPWDRSPGIPGDPVEERGPAWVGSAVAHNGPAEATLQFLTQWMRGAHADMHSLLGDDDMSLAQPLFLERIAAARAYVPQRILYIGSRGWSVGLELPVRRAGEPETGATINRGFLIYPTRTPEGWRAEPQWAGKPFAFFDHLDEVVLDLALNFCTHAVPEAAVAARLDRFPRSVAAGAASEQDRVAAALAWVNTQPRLDAFGTFASQPFWCVADERRGIGVAGVEMAETLDNGEERRNTILLRFELSRDRERAGWRLAEGEQPVSEIPAGLIPGPLAPE